MAKSILSASPLDTVAALMVEEDLKRSVCSPNSALDKIDSQAGGMGCQFPSTTSWDQKTLTVE